MRLFHGGAPGLRVGAALLPSGVTGAASLRQYAAGLGADPDFCRTDRVYATTDRSAARAYAAFHPDGALYEVELLGAVEPDPDCFVEGLSWMAPAGRVVAVVDPVVLFRSRPARAWLRMLEGPGR
jgi:hypothetical protein